MNAQQAALITPLMGAHSDGPVASVLELGAFTILLDCGWAQDFDTEDIENLRLAVEELEFDFVLLSHSDLEVCLNFGPFLASCD